MPILNYTTKRSAEQSIAAIQKLLSIRGAHKIVTDYNEGIVVAITFQMSVGERTMAFSLPCNAEGVLRAMERDHRKGVRVDSRYRNIKHAHSVGWRIVHDWIEAQMAIVDANLAEIAEVFLPYAVTSNGNTLYNEVKGGRSSNLLLQ